MKSLNLRIFFSLCLIILLSEFVLSANSGHMLDSIDVEPGEDISYLTFKGYFETELFDKIEIDQGDSNREKRLVIPHAFINNLMMPDRELDEFPGQIITRIKLEEEILEDKANRINFLVSLQISISKELELKLELAKSSSSQLVFSFQPHYGSIEDEEEEVEKTLGPIPGVIESPPDSVLLHPVFAMLNFRKPLRLNISLLDASGKLGSAKRLAIVLQRQKRRLIEQRIGMSLQILNISSIPEGINLTSTKIYFRPNMLKEALILADAIPGEQVVEQMSALRSSKLKTDIEIYVGQNFK